MTTTMLDADEAIFASTGQAVHVAFLIMAQPAQQDGPLRKALIRVMESIQLTSNQRHWLDELRGASGGTVNFGRLDGNDIRAQCAMITQAVATSLPPAERWVLQAKFGQAEFEDVLDNESAASKPAAALEQARKNVVALRTRLNRAVAELGIARENLISTGQRIVRPEAHESARARYQSAREDVRAISADLNAAEAKEQAAQIAAARPAACGLVDNGPRLDAKGKRGVGGARRRYAFSAERIDAIKGLSDWFAPMFPQLKPMAIDCMLGRIFANHKKLEISVRDLANSFGGNYQAYQRASSKMKEHINELEQMALGRLEDGFRRHGVIN